MPSDLLLPPVVRPHEENEEHVVINPSVLYVGTPVALITTINPDGGANITPMSSIWSLGDRVILGLSSMSKGCENILRDGQMVINFPTSDIWSRVEAIGRTTGRNPVPPQKEKIGYRFESDKFAVSGLTPQVSGLVRPPRISECPLQFEAKLIANHTPGAERSEDLPQSFAIIEAKVIRVHAQPNIVVPGTNHIDTNSWRPLLYMFRHYFQVGGYLGRTFKADT